MNLTREQVKVLEGAAFAWQQDCNEYVDDTVGYRSGEWLLPDYWYVDFDFQALVRAGLLEVSNGLSEDQEEYFRITNSGLKLLNN